MSILSSVRARRFAKQRSEALQSLITFRLDREWFALPIEAVQKVIPFVFADGDPIERERLRIRYQDREIVVIDVKHRLFREQPRSIAPNDPPYLAILLGDQGALFGLPLDSPPSLRRVPRAAFLPIPASYGETAKIDGLSSTLIQLADHPTLFLLDTRQLLARVSGSRS